MSEAVWYLLLMGAWSVATMLPGAMLARAARHGVGGARSKTAGGLLIAAGFVGLAVLTALLATVFLRGGRAGWE